MDYRKLVLVAALVGAAVVPHVLFTRQPYFVDEDATLLNAIRFLSERTLVPFHSKYPTFYSYLALPFIAAGLPPDVVFGDTNRLQAYLAQLYVLRPLDMALPARLFSVGLLVASCIACYRMISPRKGFVAGLAAALILLLTPALFRYGSFALPDVAVLAFSMFSLAQLLNLVERYPDRGSLRSLFWASVTAGLAISSKYTAIAAVVPIAATVAILTLQHRIDLFPAMRLLFLAALCCVAAFLAGSPGWLLAPLHFLSGLLFEIRHAEIGHLGASGVPILGYFELLANGAPAMLLTGVIGIGVWARRGTADGWIALTAILSGLLLSAFSSKQSLHYLFPGFAGWLYFSGIFTAAAMHAARKPTLVALVACAALLYGKSYVRGASYLAPNTTQLAENWIYRNIPPGERIATDWAYVPYLYSPARVEKLRASYGHNAEPIIEEINRTKKSYDVMDMRYEAAWLIDTSANYLATSEHVFARFFCNGLFTNRVPPKEKPLRQEFDRRKHFYEALFQSDVWRLAHKFETGNGPRTYVFVKKPATASAAAMNGSDIASQLGCG